MIIYKDSYFDSKLDYFKSKYPILKDTSIRLSQDLGRNDRGQIRVGTYDIPRNLIILLDSPIIDFYPNNTLAHEVAHALNWLIKKGRGHNTDWKTFCNDIYVKTGILPSHMGCYSTSEDSVGTGYISDFTYAQLKTIQIINNPDTNCKILEGDDDTVIYVKRHKARVRYWMTQFAEALLERADHHDDSKLKEPEISMWREMDKEPRYPYSEDPESDYQKKLRKYKPVFEQHWRNNRHHWEFFQMGLDPFGPEILDLIELICDQLLGYKFNVSYLEAMKDCQRLKTKFGLSEELTTLIENTVRNHFVDFGGSREEAQIRLQAKTDLRDLPTSGVLIDLRA